jgi:hypothetical protein
MVKGDLFGHIYCRDTYYAIMIQLHLFFGKAKAIFGSKVAGEPKAMSRPSPATNIDHRTSAPHGPQPAGEKERRHVARTRDVGRVMRLFDGTIEALAIAQREQRDVRRSIRPKPLFTITVRDPVCLPRRR